MLARVLKRVFSSTANSDVADDAVANVASVAIAQRSPSGAYLPPRSIPDPNNVTNFHYPIYWGVREPERFADSVKDLTQSMSSAFHAGDNFVTWGRNNSMLADLPFVEAWNSNIESESDRAIVWRRYVLATSAFHCAQLEGDFVECGSYTGVGVKTIVDYLGGVDFAKTFWAYDVFEHDAEKMVNHPMPELSAHLYDRVKAKFAAYPQVKLIKGMVPDSFEGNCPEKIAYLHIDMNQAPAEIAALDVLFDRVVSGGMVILDDYEWAAYRAQKLAEDEWFDARGYRVMPLPTGQGLVIKR
jgi:O-methyltransferase